MSNTESNDWFLAMVKSFENDNVCAIQKGANCHNIIQKDRIGKMELMHINNKKETYVYPEEKQGRRM